MLSLDDKLRLIGIRLSGDHKISNEWIDIERTLIEASYEASKNNRLLSLLFSWMKVHGTYLITEKLLKVYKEISSERGENPWFNALLIFASAECSHKFSRWLKKESHHVYWGDKESAKALIELKGAYSLFKKYNIYIPESSLRIRDSDVLTPKELTKLNRQYRNRYLYGASWRADIVTAIEMGIHTPYQISKITGCSYEPANRIFREYELVIELESIEPDQWNKNLKKSFNKHRKAIGELS